jgi:hypothetical protein
VADELLPEIGQIAVNKAVSWPKHLVRQQQSYCLNTNTRTGCWRSKGRTTKTKTSLFLNLEFFFPFFFFLFLFLSKCLFTSLLPSTPSLPVYFFGSLLFPSFISFSSYSFFLDLITFTTVSQLILNYTQNRDRNCTKWDNGKMKKGWKPFSPQK